MKRKLIGVLLLLYGLYVLFGDMWSLPKVPIFVGVVTLVIGNSLIKRLLRRKFLTSALLVMILLVIYNHYWNFLKIGTGTLLLGLIVIAIALGLLFKPTLSFSGMNNWKEISLINKKKSTHDHTVMFGESTKHIYAHEIDDVFHTACTFGELTVYLHDVDSVNKTVTIQTATRFGETVLYVPSNWEIINNVSVSFGEINMTKDVSVKNNTVILQGDVSFGELIIRYI